MIEEGCETIDNYEFWDVTLSYKKTSDSKMGIQAKSYQFTRYQVPEHL